MKWARPNCAHAVWPFTTRSKNLAPRSCRQEYAPLESFALGARCKTKERVERPAQSAKTRKRCLLFPRLAAAELVIGPQGIASVHRRRSAPHVDSESNRLHDLLAGGSVLMGHLSVVSDATFAVNRNSDRESHQFLCFSIEGFGRRCRGQKRAKGLRRIWRALPQQPDPAYYVVGDLRIVLAHIVPPSIDDSLRAEVGSAARIDKYQETRTASVKEWIFFGAKFLALSPSYRQC